MGRPKKLSGNDLFMLGKLRGDGLYLKIEDSAHPITTYWYKWRGLKLSGRYCSIDKEYRLPNKDKKPTTKNLGRRKNKGIYLGALGFGNTPQETNRINKRNNYQANKFLLNIIICKRLLEYKEKKILSKMLTGHDSERSLYRILKNFSFIARNTGITERSKKKYEIILNKLGLPKK